MPNSALPECNGTGRCATLRAPRPGPLHHRANRAQMKPGLSSSPDETKGSAHALGRVVLAKRERVIMLEPWDKGLMATTLRYSYEIRDAKEYFDDIPDVKVEPDMLKLAQHILQSKATDFDPSQFVDH